MVNMDEPANASRLRIRGPVVAVLGLVMLVAGYVLSYGPSTRLTWNNRMPFSTWARVYKPLHWISEKWPVAGDAFTWYAQMWQPEFWPAWGTGEIEPFRLSISCGFGSDDETQPEDVPAEDGESTNQ